MGSILEEPLEYQDLSPKKDIKIPLWTLMKHH